jgi:2-hydroxychromene-2-carboxylate isomerase
MHAPIRFYFDFASPYAYFSLEPLEQLAARHQRRIEWRPVLVWAVLKAHKIPAPTTSPVKWQYLMHDMVRSAAYFGVDYSHPSLLPLSTHRAARLFYAIEQYDRTGAVKLARQLFRAFFAEGRDPSDSEVLCDIAAAHGLSRSAAQEAIDGDTGRARLATEIEQAVADGVCGSPFFIIDGEGFFGADRLAQVEWRLTGQTRAAACASNAS